MTAFEHAWTLLKQRDFEVDPRYEDERMQRLEEGYDEKDGLKDKLRDIHSQLQASDYGSDELHAERDNLENELYQLMRNPEGARYGDPPMNMIEAQTGAMFQEQQRQEAMEREAMGRPSTVYDTEHGFDHPNFTEDEYFPFEPTEKPPANIGMAGSLTPAPFRPDLEQLRQSMTPLGQALARVRAGSGPQPLQFDQ